MVKVSNEDLCDLGKKFEIYRSQAALNYNGRAKRYTEELKNQCCSFLKSGVSKKILSEYLKIAEVTIYSWSRNYDKYLFERSDSLTEIKQLKIVSENDSTMKLKSLMLDQEAEIEFNNGIRIRIHCSKLDKNFLKILGDLT